LRSQFSLRISFAFSWDLARAKLVPGTAGRTATRGAAFRLRAPESLASALPRVLPAVQRMDERSVAPCDRAPLVRNRLATARRTRRKKTAPVVLRQRASGRRHHPRRFGSCSCGWWCHCCKHCRLAGSMLDLHKE
jgi:hypothetical protein